MFHRCSRSSILRTSSILGVSSTFRTASTGSMSSTEGLNTASTGSMSSTEGLNTASTGSMSSKSTASAGVSPESNPKYLGAWSIEYPQYSTPKYCEYSQSIYSRNTACTLSTPVAPHESNLLQRALVGPSVKVFFRKTRRNCRIVAETVEV